jgi:hypothetical protein
MSYIATTFKVMIASPSDVENERRLIRETIHEWNDIYSEARKIVLMPIGWDTHASPAMGDRPQGIVNKQVLKGCDLLVAVFWTRIGSPTGKAVSGTVEEIEEHIAGGKPTMIYFSQQPVRPDSVDEQQYNAVREFKTKCSERGLVETYESLSDFKNKFSRQLALTVTGNSYFGQPANSAVITPILDIVAANEVKDTAIPDLADEARTLLLEASEDRSGTIMKLAFIGGFHIETNGKQFVEPKNPRSRAVWESAIKQLCELGLVEERGYKGEIFGITAEGYRVADTIRTQGGS